MIMIMMFISIAPFLLKTALYSINNNSKPLNIYKLKINETKYKFKYTLNAKKNIHSP